MTSKHLNALRANKESVLSNLGRAVDLLESAGIIPFLFERARPSVPDGGNSIHKTAFEGARSQGYFDCLEDLIYLADRYLNDPIRDTGPKATFGAGSKNVSGNVITPKEQEAIRNGDKPPILEPVNLVRAAKQRDATVKRGDTPV